MPSLRCPNCFYATSVKKDEVQGVTCQTCEYDLFHYYYAGRDEATVSNFIAEENKRLKKEKGRADRAALKEQTSSPKSDEPKSPARRWFKVAGYLLLLIVALRVVGVNDYIDNYRAEKALAEQMEQGGFLSVDEYYNAQSLNITTKALYDQHLVQQAEISARLEEKRKAEASKRRAEYEKARLAEEAKVKELIELTQHIRNGGRYALVDIGKIDAELFSGKTCSEILGLRASLQPEANHPYRALIVNGTGEIYVFGERWEKNKPDYRMPSGCNIFSSPATVERICRLEKKRPTEETYKRYTGTGLVKIIENPLRPGRFNNRRVIASSDGKNLTSAVVELRRTRLVGDNMFTSKSRAYICRN